MLRINLDELFVNCKTTAIINDRDTVTKELKQELKHGIWLARINYYTCNSRTHVVNQKVKSNV